MTATESAANPTRRRVEVAVAVLAIALLIGGAAMIWATAGRSAARFADAEVLRDNQLGAATLAIEVGTTSTALTATDLAPGDEISAQLDVANVGTLPLLLTVRLTTDGGPLASALEFWAWTATDRCRVDDVALGRADSLTATATGQGLVDVTGDADLALAVEESLILCLGARLPIASGNEVQGGLAAIDVVLDAVHDLAAEDA